MNSNIEKLYRIGGKPVRRIIGLMSGTSVDGLDVALCEFTGTGMDTSIDLVEFVTVPYPVDYKNEIASIFSKKQVDLEKLTILNGWIALQHASIILDCLKQWNISAAEIDMIASHGQTIFHAPKSLHGHEKFGNATLQLGDGDHMAVATGIITASDFRQKHIAGGGEGAPLAAYGDYLIFSKSGENRIMLNIGGIANFTFLPGDLDADKVFCSDTGSGNTLMDALMRDQYPGKYFDEGAKIALAGTIQPALLRELKNHPFFKQPFPKTTGPELFNMQYLKNAQAVSGTGSASIEDLMATLNRFSAETIAEAIQSVTGGNKDFEYYVSGGGMHNPLLMTNLRALLPVADFRTVP
ncbi:MAG: anhydro-N-acetylmuramic acid kinase [Chitinophagaceae bacterium]|nr:MAG: anhydro-N-acetylmuramic acid kinase [Chitinophagaceae bacterium]